MHGDVADEINLYLLTGENYPENANTTKNKNYTKNQIYFIAHIGKLHKIN